MDDEWLESAEFEPEAIPWDELAFRSTDEGLRDYLAGLLHPLPQQHVEPGLSPGSYRFESARSLVHGLVGQTLRLSSRRR